MAVQTVWSVDLGKSSLKAVKLRRDRNNVEIVAVDKVNYPLSGEGDLASRQREALEIFVSRNSVKEPVAVTHPGQGTFSRFIKVPAFDEKKVDEMVGYEASQQIPFPLDEVIWDFHVIDREYLPGEEREVALFAVRREAMDDFLLEFTSQELTIDTVSIGYLGLLNFVAHDIAPDEPSVILDIGATHTDLVLVDGERFWVRPLPHSGNDITKAIEDRFRLDHDKAERLKVETARVPPKKAVQIFQAVIQPKLQDLLGEIQRSIGFYRSQHGEVSFSKVYLLGNGSKIIGIKKFLEESLGIPVEKVQSINHFRVAREVNLKLLQVDLPAFGTCLGAGLQALGLGPCKVDLVPQEEKLAKEVGRKRKHVFFAAGILVVAMLIAYVITSMNFRAAQTTYRAAREAVKPLAGGQDEVTRYKDALNRYRDLYAKMVEPAQLRALALAGIQSVDKVLAGLPTGRAIERIVDKKDGGAEGRVSEELEAELFKRVWLVAANIGEAKVEAQPGGLYRALDERDAHRATGAVLNGYKFELGVVIKKQDDATTSANFVRESFVKPLESELQSRGLAIVPFSQDQLVQLGTGQDIPEVGLDKSGRPTTIVKDEDTGAEGQDGGPYFAIKVLWTLVPELPKPEEPEEPDDEFGDDDDDDDFGDDADTQ